MEASVCPRNSGVSSAPAKCLGLVPLSLTSLKLVHSIRAAGFLPVALLFVLSTVLFVTLTTVALLFHLVPLHALQSFLPVFLRQSLQ